MRSLNLRTSILFTATLLLYLCFYLLNSALADGWYISDRDLHLHEPNQKAVIYWDGEMETMILSAAIKSDKIADFAWVIPVKSCVKPVVTAGDISVFEDLVEYFKKPTPKPRIIEASGDLPEVELLEQKQIGVYDIAILKSTSADDLIKWLAESNYEVPSEARNVLDGYFVSGDCYFVANKINLANRFSTEVEEALEIYENLRAEYFDICDEICRILHGAGVDESIFHLEYRDSMWNAREDYWSGELRGLIRTIATVVEEHLNKRIAQELEWEGMECLIRVKLGEGLVLKGCLNTEVGGCDKKWPWKLSWGTNWFWIHKGEYPVGHFEVDFQPNRSTNELQITPHIKLGSIPQNVTLKDCSKQDINVLTDISLSRGSAYKSFLEQVRLRAHVIEQIIVPEAESLVAALEPVVNSLIACHADLSIRSVRNGLRAKTVQDETLENKLLAIYKHFNTEPNRGRIELSGDLQRFHELYQCLRRLRNGMETPLKFQFQPNHAYYPLVISSLNGGRTKIEVYVTGRDSVDDGNRMLTRDLSKTINPDIRKKLSKHFEVGKAKYITRLLYDGDVRELTADAIFLDY